MKFFVGISRNTAIKSIFMCFIDWSGIVGLHSNYDILSCRFLFHCGSLYGRNISDHGRFNVPGDPNVDLQFVMCCKLVSYTFLDRCRCSVYFLVSRFRNLQNAGTQACASLYFRPPAMVDQELSWNHQSVDPLCGYARYGKVCPIKQSEVFEARSSSLICLN